MKPKAERQEIGTPLHDRVIVRRIEEGETTRGGIIIPDNAKEKPQEGEILAVGKASAGTTGHASLWTCNRETACFSENTPVRKSRLTGKNFSS